MAWQGLLKLYPQYGAVVDTPNGFFYWLAFIALALAFTASVYDLLRRRFRVGDLALGALAWWLIAAVAAIQWMPGASYVLVWPLLFSLIGLGLLWVLPEQMLGPWRRAMLLAATALPALLLVAWWPYAIYLALGTDLLVVPVVLMLLLFGLFIPHLDQFARRHGRVLPVGAGLVAVAALIAGGLTAHPNADHPQADSVFYALNADTGQALWVSADPAPDAWTSQFLGTAYRRGELPELFPYLSDMFLSAPAPALDLPAARVDLLSDRSSGGTRTVSLRVTAAADVQWVELKIRSASPIESLTLARTPVPINDDLAQSEQNEGWYTCQYWLPPAQGFELSIAAASPGLVEVLAQTYRFGLPQVPGLVNSPRPADRMPLAREFLPKNKTDLVMVARSFTFEE